MLLLSRILSSVSAFSVLVVLSIAVRWPAQWPYWLAIVILVAVATALLLIKLIKKEHSRFDLNAPDFNTSQLAPTLSWWQLLPTPILLSSVALGLLLFLETELGRQLLIILAAALIGLFWENIRRHWQDVGRYPKHYLESASLLIHVAVVWVAAAGFFRLLLDPTILPIFLATNAYTISTIIIILAVFLLDFRAIWLSRYPADRVWLLLVIESLLVGEFFWMLNFLPLSPDVKAFLVAIEYYTMAALARSHFDGTLNLVVIRRYVYFIFAVSIAVLVTARWLV
ncbi:hypothetical protein A3H10_03850 [Candidatus Uhrbacteria bacterium RIFCSPLOWO2_12_FULL_46_10]|uniref:Uncharacterized protein n=1 Tax=Candidatus Uhrbacteria bacterium RIFCSPLOWO2_01_FULL_47_25 TaxID=1802402 RepID=A0A1F7URS7_9BACT|nr:MAG: hypothetical protein UX68_C0005G0014 [Parcubacteria group bacterium GW2011_GWA2_46_9]OGL60621.1 MAG: hypothetical protein A2752_02225 [Candidatus Uhrbacteria bacterium RIFCSPHIGHO2_01_FULL_46_23]OGL68140.1 MAG: hypothetical protein A3D60_04010 [Candidatus Uhrbacteria bacterium RIFCSPHIGHO2_02_FULL_47_29]OGL74815.1 MAG: hypothetical protein A3E96_04675 [Candidatus Uhrbacteria bacterium RIFCSPHIGHO2_12_FULL_46_13]OGL80991.1 MAG: hypothetical protein A2936_03345 [Candidatus Uhrbacteria bac